MKNQITKEKRHMVSVVKGQYFDQINQKNIKVYFYVEVIASGSGKEPRVFSTKIISTPITIEAVNSFTNTCLGKSRKPEGYIPMMTAKNFIEKFEV